MNARSASRVVALMAALALSRAVAVGAATFSVNPTQVFLSSTTSSALISLRNESRDPLRFQLSLFAWDQRPNGEMTLAPTQDLVFFPQLVTLAAGEERKVRVGLAPSVKPSSTERTYRLFVEELPPSQAEGPAQGVKVLTKMGLPIFVQPGVAAPRPTLGQLTLAGDRLAFTARNEGNAHFVPDRITVEAFAADGRVLSSHSINGWYILAGGTREFDVQVPAEDCGRVASLRVTLRAGQETVTSRLDTPSGACRM